MRTTLRLGLTWVVIGIASGCATDARFNTAQIVQHPYKPAILDTAVVEKDEIVTFPTLSGEQARVVPGVMPGVRLLKC